MATPPTFDITPEKEASKLQCMRRQLFVTPPLITDKDASLAGKTAIITGSNGGIGLECARQFLDLGITKLILTGRDEAKNEAALKDLNIAESGRVELWKLDMLSYESIVSFVEKASRLDQLHIVVLNAGIMRTEMQLTPSTGHEEDVQTNFLSTALLTLLFLRIFKARHSGTGTPPGRIVIVSSDTAAWSKFKERSENPLLSAFDDQSKKWDTMERYATSKLLTQFFVTELAKRVKPELAIVNMANPGLCHGSGLGRSLAGVLSLALNALAGVAGRSPSIGARALVDAAVKKGAESHGQYCEDGKIRPMAPHIYKPEMEEVSQRLWDETIKELSPFGADAILREIGQ